MSSTPSLAHPQTTTVTGNVYRLVLEFFEHHTGKITRREIAWVGENLCCEHLRNILRTFVSKRQMPNGRTVRVQKRFEVKRYGVRGWKWCPDPTQARA